jgi:hypothetical protein
MVSTQPLTVPAPPLTAFHLPASTVRVELWRGGDQWSLAYLGLTAMGLEVVDDDFVGWEGVMTDSEVAELIEGRLRALGRHPMRIRCDLAPPLVAAWKV